MKIMLAETNDEIQRCFPVMVQLRPHLEAAEFVNRVRRQAEGGYQIAFLETGDGVKAVAGFRITEMLVRGRFMYVDDLVTDENSRSKGYGAALLDWLSEHALENQCTFLELDSGVQRAGAHRFYFSQRMTISSYHFSLPLTG